MKRFSQWKYKNLTALLVSLIILFVIVDTPYVQQFIHGIGDLGYLGAFIVGIFFVSTYTVAPSIVVLFTLANELNPLAVALIAGAGSLVGDFILFRFVRDNLIEELKLIVDAAGGKYVRALYNSKFFIWLAPVLGAIIIASPFPDEIGIGMMGASKLKTWQFLAIAYVLNVTGIFIVVSIARLT